MVGNAAANELASRKARRGRSLALWTATVLVALVAIGFCALNPWLCLGLIPVMTVAIFSYRARRRGTPRRRSSTVETRWAVNESLRPGRGRIAGALGLVVIVLVTLVALLLLGRPFEYSSPPVGSAAPEPTGHAPVRLPTFYESTLRFDGERRDWSVDSKLTVTFPTASPTDRIDLINALGDEGWLVDDRTFTSDPLVFLKSDHLPAQLNRWRRVSSQDFYFTPPYISGFRFSVERPPKVTLITPKYMVAGTLPSADPVDLLSDKQEQRILDLGKNEGDLLSDTARIQVYNPLLRTPSGVKLAGWSSGPIAWTAVSALLGLVWLVLTEDVLRPRLKRWAGKTALIPDE